MNRRRISAHSAAAPRLSEVQRVFVQTTGGDWIGFTFTLTVGQQSGVVNFTDDSGELNDGINNAYAAMFGPGEASAQNVGSEEYLGVNCYRFDITFSSPGPRTAVTVEENEAGGSCQVFTDTTQQGG